MKILILGGAGFLGSNLIRKCLEDSKNKVTVVDSLETRLKSSLVNLEGVKNSIKFIKGDMRSKSLMEKMVKDQEIIFNCAGQTSHPLSLSDPIFDVELNCIGNLVLLEALRKYNPKARIIYTSSSTIVGKAFFPTVDEWHGERPLDIYSANKGVVEKYYYIYKNTYGLNTVSLRFANLYGPYGKGYPEFGFINYFISLAHKNKEIPIYGNGKQHRNVMYVEDACDLLYNCIKRNDIFGEVFFAVHREHYSVMQIAKTIISVFGKGKIKKISWPKIRKRIEINDVLISGARLYYKMRWEPKYSLREGLLKTKNILEKNR